MDLVGYSQERFDEIVADYTAFAEGIGLKNFLPIPISGLKGDNITLRSDSTPWYNGPVLLDHLETVELDTERLAQRPRSEEHTSELQSLMRISYAVFCLKKKKKKKNKKTINTVHK